MRFIGAAAIWATAASIGLAQTPPDPATDPALNEPRVEERARDLERRPHTGALTPAPAPGAAPARQPATAKQNGGTPPDRVVPAPRAAPLRKEGTFLLRQRGSPVRLRTGEWLFVFHRDDKGRAERSMVLVPCRNLERLEQAAGPDPEGQTFVVTGQVFAYRGASHLLLTVPPLLDTSSTRSETPVPGAPEAPKPKPLQPEEDPGLDDVIRALEAHRNRPRGLGAALPTDKTEAGGTRDRRPAILPEGTMLVRRRGRLARVSGESGGETALILDSDTDSPTTIDPPLILSRCLPLERMEQLALAQGEALVFEVSGRVLAYEGRNYLIPMIFRLYPPTELERRQ